MFHLLLSERNQLITLLQGRTCWLIDDPTETNFKTSSLIQSQIEIHVNVDY